MSQEQTSPAGEFASVHRAMAVLELLAQSPVGLSVTELAESLGQTKTTAFRILATLQNTGYVDKDPKTALYRLTFKLITLSYRLMSTRGIDEFLTPVLRGLAAETRELVRLAIAEDDSLRWIAQANGSEGRVRLQADLGDSIALHASASGKAWLSTLPGDEALRIVLTRGMEARTPSTITDAQTFLTELTEVRTRGYALALEEGDLGVLAVAVPVRSGSEPAAVGTLSVAGTVMTVDRDRLVSFVPDLVKAADVLADFWRAMDQPVPGEAGRAGPASGQ
ncbi:MAG TPA: IclR family transcriptional regulator [Streptosporangiaceae bacterium]